MVEPAGGMLSHMEAIWFYVYATPDFRDPAGQRGLVFRATPAYVWVNQAGARKTLGGVRTDLQCRVLGKELEPIPGLYAAGAVAGMAGGHINGDGALEGTMLGPSIFSGRVAGAWAAHNAGLGSGFVSEARANDAEDDNARTTAGLR